MCIRDRFRTPPAFLHKLYRVYTVQDVVIAVTQLYSYHVQTYDDLNTLESLIKIKVNYLELPLHSYTNFIECIQSRMW